MYTNGIKPNFCWHNLLAGSSTFYCIRHDFCAFCDLFLYVIGREIRTFSSSAVPFGEVEVRLLAEKRLSAALDKVEKISRDKTILMTTISHELRTPLNGIIGLSRILLEEQPTARQSSYLRTINSSAVSLSHIFSDILDLEKIDAHRIELNRKETKF